MIEENILTLNRTFQEDSSDITKKLLMINNIIEQILKYDKENRIAADNIFELSRTIHDNPETKKKVIII